MGDETGIVMRNQRAPPPRLFFPSKTASRPSASPTRFQAHPVHVTEQEVHPCPGVPENRWSAKRIENAANKDNARFIQALQRLARRDWWAQQLGQIPASEVLPLCSCEQRKRERTRREFLAMDPFEHREE